MAAKLSINPVVLNSILFYHFGEMILVVIGYIYGDQYWGSCCAGGWTKASCMKHVFLPFELSPQQRNLYFCLMDSVHTSYS